MVQGEEVESPRPDFQSGALPAELPLRCLERVNGIEPSSSAWKAVTLPIELHPR